jgi:hypothetical protein
MLRTIAAALCGGARRCKGAACAVSPRAPDSRTRLDQALRLQLVVRRDDGGRRQAMPPRRLAHGRQPRTGGQGTRVDLRRQPLRELLGQRRQCAA